MRRNEKTTEGSVRKMPGVRSDRVWLAFVMAPLALGAVMARPGAAQPPASKQAKTDERAALNAREALLILERNCLTCHRGEKPMGALRLTSREDTLKGGHSGPAVSLQKPAESRLLQAVRHEGLLKMPPSGRLPQAQIDTLTRWVEQGLLWPKLSGQSSESQREKHAGPPPPTDSRARTHWAFQPVRPPAVPKVKNAAWVKNPIDAFVLAKLEKAGLQPNPPASRAALIRRATYDLTGLPPGPEEVRAFLADKSPDAYEKLVDRLLASPRYGEKWGRHWLDLVRYAESDSYERDNAKPNAWRYRDYVIRSLNADKPYDQFLIEQLAGDELPVRTPERLIATGYYRLGLWDDEPVDPKQALYDDLDDILSTTGQVFLGLTVNCARCHDHKIDPIPQKDYYRLLAFFNGVRRYGVRSPESVAEASLRPIAPPQVVQQHRAEVAAYQAKVKANQDALTAIEAKVMPDFIPVEKEEFRNEALRAQIVQKRVPKLLSQEMFDRYVALTEEKKRLAQAAPKALDMALCVTEEGAKARKTHVLLRGNAHVEGDEVQPGFPTVLQFPDPPIAPGSHGDTAGRRLALARWIASPKNPLTARVMVNRVWHYHFGRGIVRTPSDFGFQGAPPTHPELLDWLSAYFVGGAPVFKASGLPEKIKTSKLASPNNSTQEYLKTPSAQPWSLKALHRLIMLSNTYQMASQGNAKALAKDPANDLFWRFDMRRLLAEEVRDSILAVNGSLNLAMYGPSIYPTIPEAVLAGQSIPGAGWGQSSPEEQRRRSVYIFVKRSLITPILASFDGPDTDFSCPARFATTQPTQALGMLNSDFLNQQARIFADTLRQKAGPDPQKQVRLALWRVFQREPTPKEVSRGVRLMADMQMQHGVRAEEALVQFCLIALNLNEFLYLD
jgi:mono/diheme cytochrome c family protein